MPKIIRLKTKDLKASFRQSQESPLLIETPPSPRTAHRRGAGEQGQRPSV
jgi:hypothetical protein